MEPFRLTLNILDCFTTDVPLSADQVRIAHQVEEALANEGRPLPRSTIYALLRVFQLGADGHVLPAAPPPPADAIPVVVSSLEPVSKKERTALKKAAKQALGTPLAQTQFRMVFRRIRNQRIRGRGPRRIASFGKCIEAPLSLEERNDLKKYAAPFQKLDFDLGHVSADDCLPGWCEFPALFELLFDVSRYAFHESVNITSVDMPLIETLLELGASPDTPNEAAWQCASVGWPKLSARFSARQLMAYSYNEEILAMMSNHSAPPPVTDMKQSLLWWAVLAHLARNHGDFLYRLPHQSGWIKDFKATVAHILENEPASPFHAQIIRLAVAKNHPMAEFLKSEQVLGRCTAWPAPVENLGWVHRFGKLSLSFARSTVSP